MRFLTLVSVGVLLVGLTSSASAKDLGPDNAVARFLEDLVLGPGREYRALALFPVLLDGPERPFPSVDIREAARRDAIAFAEAKGGAAVRTLGFGLEKVFLLQGEMLIGGKVDRMLARDASVAPKTDMLVRSLLIEAPNVPREHKPTFEAPGLLAPPYLRMAALRGDGPAAVARMLEHYGSLLPKGARAQSIPEVALSARMQFLTADYVAEFERLPQDVGGRVIGVVALVGGQPVLWECFGTPALFGAHWPRILASLGFAASGHELRAGTAGQPVLLLPAEGPERFTPRITNVRTNIAGADVKSEKPLEMKARYRFTGARVVGAMSCGPAGPIHVAAFPFLPSDDQRYSRRVPDEPEDETESATVSELLRREAEGTLSEHEKRYLDRIRRRRARMGGPDLPKPDPGLPTQPGPVRPKPGDLPGTEKPKPPKPGTQIPPPKPGGNRPGGGSGGGGSGGGSGGGGREIPPPPGRK